MSGFEMIALLVGAAALWLVGWRLTVRSHRRAQKAWREAEDARTRAVELFDAATEKYQDAMTEHAEADRAALNSWDFARELVLLLFRTPKLHLRCARCEKTSAVSHERVVVFLEHRNWPRCCDEMTKLESAEAKEDRACRSHLK